MPDRRSRRRGPALIACAIVLLALALRLVVAGVVVNANDAEAFRTMHGDAPGYIRLAERIANGEDYAGGRPVDTNRALVRPPGYPAWLTLLHTLPNLDLWADARPIVWPQAILSALAAGVAFVGVRRLTRSTPTAAIAGTLVALSPTAIAAASIMMPDGMHGSAFGVAFLALAIVALGPSKRRRTIGVIGGIALSVAVALKPASMYWPAFGLAILVAARGFRPATLFDALRLFAPAVVVVCLWTWHNAHFVGVATYSTVASRNLRYDVVPRVEFFANKGRFPTRKEYEREAEKVTSRDSKSVNRRDADLPAVHKRMQDETRAAIRKHPWATFRVALDNVLVGSMVRWQRSDRQFRGDGTLAPTLRAVYDATGNQDARHAWYVLLGLALPLAAVRRDWLLAKVAGAATIAFGYVALGITTIPSEGSRLLAAAEVPAAVLAAITLTSLVALGRSAWTRRRRAAASSPTA